MLQELDLDFQSAKFKKSLVFAELIAEFPTEEDVVTEEDSFPNGNIFLISTSDPWYGDILIYLHPSKYPAASSWVKHRCKIESTPLRYKVSPMMR